MAISLHFHFIFHLDLFGARGVITTPSPLGNFTNLTNLSAPLLLVNNTLNATNSSNDTFLTTAQPIIHRKKHFYKITFDIAKMGLNYVI